MHAKLVVVGGDTKTKEIRLRLPVVIGRGRDATLTLPHPLVSRQHCEIIESDGQLLVRDLGSLNGTFVANERITESVLPHGELLTVGTVTFRAVYDDDLDANEHTPSAPSESDDTIPLPDETTSPPQIAPRLLPAESADSPSPSDSEPTVQAEDSADDEDLNAFFKSLE